MRLLSIVSLFSFVFLVYSASSQSENYRIESFQDEYIEISDYESMSTIFGGDPLWEYEFQLQFQFPFYGMDYDKLIYRSEAWGSVTDEQDEAIYLMDYFGGYSYSPLMDTNNIESDVRFGHVLSGDAKAFVVQFTKMRFFADPFIDSLNTYMNFQLWFFENGVMEVHFGEMHMDGNPVYKPGRGFYCFTTDEGIDTSQVCGPHVGISNPFDIEDGIAIKGAYDNFVVTSDIYDNLTVLPPHGWVFRFLPRSVGFFEPNYRISQFAITPNPANSFILIPETDQYIGIYSLSGTIMFEGFNFEHMLDVSTFPAGFYFVKTLSDRGAAIGKFIKL